MGGANRGQAFVFIGIASEVAEPGGGGHRGTVPFEYEGLTLNSGALHGENETKVVGAPLGKAVPPPVNHISMTYLFAWEY